MHSLKLSFVKSGKFPVLFQKADFVIVSKEAVLGIIEVKTKKQLKEFVEFPNKLYKGNEYYCPPMASDEINTFIPSKNPGYEFCESKQFLAYKDNKLVGRIAGIINYAHIERQNKKQIRFARFDAIDDIEVTKALFNAVKEYGKDKKMDEMNQIMVEFAKI